MFSDDDCVNCKSGSNGSDLKTFSHESPLKTDGLMMSNLTSAVVRVVLVSKK